MMSRSDRLYLLTILVATCCMFPTERAFAQLDVIRGFFGVKTQQAQQAAFQGHQQLQQAVQAAEKGEIKESLIFAREAFKVRGDKDLFNDGDVQLIGPNLMRLVKAWSVRNAPPTEVAEILRDVVVPTKPAGRVFAFPTPSQLTYDINIMNRQASRLAAPESVGAELVRWSVLAKQTDEVKRRLHLVLDGAQPKEASKGAKPSVKTAQAEREAAAAPIVATAAKFDATTARVILMQLTIAEKDAGAANKLLKALINDIKHATEPQLDYLCHAVSAGLREPQSEQSALLLLEAIAERAMGLSPESNFRLNAPSLLVYAADLHAKVGRSDDAKRCALAAIAKPLNAQRYGADYSKYLHHLLKQQAAEALLRAGAITEGLDLATGTPDPQVLRYGSGVNSFNIAISTARELRKLAPAERYELLRKWALPSGDQTAVRSVVDFVSPELFPDLGSGLLHDVYSTSWELVVTARELGKLDELIRELAATPVQSSSVKSFRTLALVMREGSANRLNDASSSAAASPAVAASEVPARLAELLAVTTKEVPPWEMANKPQPPLDTYVVAVEAALHPEWREVAESLMKQLIEHGQRTQAARIRDHFRMAFTELMRLRISGGSVTSHFSGELGKQHADGRESPTHADWLKLRPKMWDAINFATASERMMGALPPTWFAHEGYLSHVSNGAESDLCFAFPLTGSFELNAECREGGWTEGLMGYGGVSCQIYAYNDAVYITGKGGSGFENSPKMTNLLHRSPWNRYTIQVEGNTVRHFANGQLVLEDQLGTAAPWLTLGGKVGFTPTYRNLRITGSPTIPREVVLLGDPRLRGWIASHYGESKPEALRSRRYIQVKVTQNNQTYSVPVEDDGTMQGEPVEVNQSQTDWMLVDGELRSARRNSFWADESPSWMSYQRPLRDGETVRYEFFYEAGKTTAHPTLGETVYMLGRLGNKHDATANGQDVAQVAEVSDTKKNHSLARRACAGELKSGWNTVAMSLNGGMFQIELNGKETVAENVTPTNSRRIGFFHDAARTDLRIRNVVLTGDWPKTFDEVRAAIETPMPTEPLPNSRFLTHVVEENYYSDNAYAIYRHAVKLETPERFQFLRRWVMPNESSDLLRTSGAFTPTHPAPPVLNENPIDVATAEARQAIDTRCVQTGGNFVSPALLLVLAAMELNRLPELKQQIMELPPGSSLDMARSRAAMLGIIALLEDSPSEALQWIRELQVVAGQYKDAPMYSRWGDVMLASLAIQHPVTRDAAFEMLEFLLRTQIQAGNQGTAEYSRFVRQLHGQCVFLMHGGEPDAFGTNPKTQQWRTVSQPRARSRGDGIPISSFDIVAGEMAQRGGHDYDAVYFQSPLRGNYEVSCRLSHFDFREAMLMTAGIANALKYTHSDVRLSHPRSAIKELPLATPITPKVYQWHDYKIVVKDGRYASFVNGQKLYEEELPVEHDPWIAVVGWAGHSSRAVRDIIIAGQPTIPRELNLLGTPDLRGWMTDYYAPDWGQTPFEWKLLDDELTSPQLRDANPARDRRKVENIIRYHRPMLEDGEISYEFFYDPDVKIELPPSNYFSGFGGSAPKRTARGQTVVHPALDRMVCLLDPDGVKIHWLTDGRWDRTGMKAGNAEVMKGEKLTLKAGDWNSVRFATKGDTLLIELNGDTIFTREIEPTNLRHFGLFHYANESNVRVRNVHYRGNWPTALPSVDQQDLASGPQMLAEIQSADLPDSISWDFTKSKFSLDEFRYHWDARVAKQVTPTEEGLRFVQPAGEKKMQFIGVSPKVTISGDFIATMDYEGLNAHPANESWGSGLSFTATQDGSYTTGFEVRLEAKAQNKMTRSVMSMYEPNRPNYFHSESIGEFPAAGRLRLQRHGPVLYFFTADAKSEKFRLLTQRPLGTHDIKYLVVNADASDQAAGSEFLLKSLSIRAARITKVK